MMIKGTFIGTNEIFLCSKKEISVVFNAMDIDIYFRKKDISESKYKNKDYWYKSRSGTQRDYYQNLVAELVLYRTRINVPSEIRSVIHLYPINKLDYSSKIREKFVGCILPLLYQKYVDYVNDMMADGKALLTYCVRLIDDEFIINQ